MKETNLEIIIHRTKAVSIMDYICDVSPGKALIYEVWGSEKDQSNFFENYCMVLTGFRECFSRK